MIFPFTYWWLILRSLNISKSKTILDLGCGKGEFGKIVNSKKIYKITGVDIFDPYLEICKKSGVYTKVIKSDLTKGSKFDNSSFDTVACLQTFEHLYKKQAFMLLSDIERIAKKMILITTPVGESLQDPYESNKHQKHLSRWGPKEFQERGYEVFGIGLKMVYGSKTHANESISVFKLPFYVVSFFMNPLTNLYPKIACQMIAIKRKK